MHADGMEIFLMRCSGIDRFAGPCLLSQKMASLHLLIGERAPSFARRHAVLRSSIRQPIGDGDHSDRRAVRSRPQR